MDIYTIYSNGKDIHTFRGKEEFINESLKIFNACVECYRQDWESEAKWLGFNLTPYEFDDDEEVVSGGDIIIDDDCHKACVNFWEKYRNLCKVVIEKGE